MIVSCVSPLGMQKVYSLQYLDLSHNKITDVRDCMQDIDRNLIFAILLILKRLLSSLQFYIYMYSYCHNMCDILYCIFSLLYKHVRCRSLRLLTYQLFLTLRASVLRGIPLPSPLPTAPTSSATSQRQHNRYTCTCNISYENSAHSGTWCTCI